MTIKCPYCGSEEYECFDTYKDNEESIQELCACLNCKKSFSVYYEAVDVVGEEE